MYKNIITFCFINILLFNNIVLCDIRVVETTHGKVLGKKIKTLLNGDSYYGFMGIPYAKPPVNELRFLVSSTFHLSFPSYEDNFSHIFPKYYRSCCGINSQDYSLHTQ